VLSLPPTLLSTSLSLFDEQREQNHGTLHRGYRLPFVIGTSRIRRRWVDQVACINPKPRASQPAHVIFIFIIRNAHKKSTRRRLRTLLSYVPCRYCGDTSTRRRAGRVYDSGPQSLRHEESWFLFFHFSFLSCVSFLGRRAISQREGMEIRGRSLIKIEIRAPRSPRCLHSKLLDRIGIAHGASRFIRRTFLSLSLFPSTLHFFFSLSITLER